MPLRKMGLATHTDTGRLYVMVEVGVGEELLEAKKPRAPLVII